MNNPTICQKNWKARKTSGKRQKKSVLPLKKETQIFLSNAALPKKKFDGNDADEEFLRRHQ
jgi:hypothetical protein